MAISNGEPPASWAAIAIGLAPALAGAATAAAGHFWLAVFGMPLAVLLAFALRDRVPGLWPGTAMRLTKLDRRTVITSLVATPVVLVAMSVTGVAVARWLGWTPNTGAFAGLTSNPLALVGWLALVWTTAAFGEEIVFRGIVLHNLAGICLRARFGLAGARAIALVGSAAIFGFAHAYQGRAGIAETTVAGLLFGGAFLLTAGRNLWVPILVHGLTDTAGFVSIFLGAGPG